MNVCFAICLLVMTWCTLGTPIHCGRQRPWGTSWWWGCTQTRRSLSTRGRRCSHRRSVTRWCAPSSGWTRWWKGPPTSPHSRPWTSISVTSASMGVHNSLFIFISNIQTDSLSTMCYLELFISWQ